jgi:hypothetical protein
MRRLAALALVPLLAACSGDGDRGAGPAPSPAASSATASGTPSPSAAPLDAEAVRRAVETTRAAGTARYEATLSTRVARGEVAIVQTGAYDLKRTLSSLDSDYQFDAPELAASLGIDPDQDLRTRVVTAKSDVYLHMPGWTDQRRGKWLHYTTAELAEVGGDQFSAQPFPPFVAMLEKAKPLSAPPSTPTVAHVAVPAADVFLAFPSSSTRRLVSEGLDPADLTGDVNVSVRLDAAGRITRVVADADGVFDQAYELAGVENAAAVGSLVTSVEVDLSLSAIGEPVRIAVPPRAKVIEARDLG